MLFNSFQFALFLPVIFVLYWYCSKYGLKIQNILLFVASYFFYACWDYRFMALLLFSTALDYFSAIKIHNSIHQSHKRFWLWLSITINLGFLIVFKYYNFFVESMTYGLSTLGISANITTLQIILPVGISFYTFHGLSYIIDVYKNRIAPQHNYIDYSVFVSFFPLLVAGPIERATHLLPQISQKRNFDYLKSTDGLRQILWGLFKKIVIGDNCAQFANTIFADYNAYSGSTLVLGALFFSFQIYCDFSGYSDIAIGVAKLFGIDLVQNFAFPYFSQDIAEFWRRWHISLSSWFRDYVYIPLGGSKFGIWVQIRNTFIIFVLSGFWHGANMTFIVWGVLHAFYILPSIILGTHRNHLQVVAKNNYFPTIKQFFNILTTFSLVCFAWIFFRSVSFTDALAYISKMFSKTLFVLPHFPGIMHAVSIVVLIIIFLIIEWLGRDQQYAIQNMMLKSKKSFRYAMYYTIIGLIFCFSGNDQQFIYFQF